MALNQRPQSIFAPATSFRRFSAASEGEEEEAEVMEYDVLIVGGGPAGKSFLTRMLISSLVKVLQVPFV